MPGKLPIDRVRENEDNPDVYRQDKERLTQQRARRRARGAPDAPTAARRRDEQVQPAAGGDEQVQRSEQEAGRA